MEEEREDGVSFGELIHAVVKKIWLILGISALVTIVAVLGTVFVVNPSKTVYEICFSIDYPEKDDLKYPDGSAFRYLDIIGLENLEKAKASDEKFKDIDVNAINTGNGLTIQEGKYGTNKETGAYGIIEQPGSYILRIYGSYFADRNEANDFIRALVNVPVENIKDLIGKMDFYVNLNAYNSVSTYSEKIDSLNAQKKFILDRYDLLIEFLGEDYEVRYTEGDQQVTATLRAARSNASLCFNTFVEETFRTELKNNQYLYDKTEDNKIRVQIQIEDKEIQIKQNNALLEVLKADRDALIDALANVNSGAPIGDSALGDYTTRINDLIAENNKLQREIDVLAASLINEGNQEFRAQEEDFKRRLDDEWEKLNDVTGICKQVALALYGAESEAQFETAGVTLYADGYSVLLIAIGSFVLTFLIAALIVCVIDVPRYRKKRLAEEAVSVETEEGSAEETTVSSEENKE